MSYGLHYSDTLAGRVFSQTVTPLGLTLPVYTDTALGGAGICALPLFNNSTTHVAELISAAFNYGSGATTNGAIVMMGVPLTAVATGQPVTAMAVTTPQNGYLGGGNASRMLSSNGAGTVTSTAGTAGAPSATAPGVLRSLASANQELSASATPRGVSMITYWFNGTVIVPPGYFIYFASLKALVALYCSELVWKEIPITR